MSALLIKLRQSDLLPVTLHLLGGALTHGIHVEITLLNYMISTSLIRPRSARVHLETADVHVKQAWEQRPTRDVFHEISRGSRCKQNEKKGLGRGL